MEIDKDLARLASAIRSDISDDPYGIDMIKLSALALALWGVKDAGYGRSWAKRGVDGVHHNVMRKEDRLVQLLQLSDDLSTVVCANYDEYVEPLLATLVDLSNYCLMYVSYLAKQYPDEFEKWLHYYSNEVGMGVEDIRRFIADEDVCA